MSAGILPDGYRSRPATFDDAEAVAAVIAACEAAYDLGTQTTAADVRDEWQDVDLADETVVVEHVSGSVIACADLANQHYAILRVYGYVHPEHEGEGLGRYLIDWGERWGLAHMDRADPEVQVAVLHYVSASNAGALDLFTACGYEAVRGTYVMGIELDEPLPERVWPEGIVPGVFRPGVDERGVHASIEDAIRDQWGHAPRSFEHFLAFSQREEMKPDLWIAARAENEIAGVCIGMLTGEQGWVQNISVRRAWRRKGLGLALIHACLGAFYQRGVTDVRLDVDAQSSTGANRLFERAGMHVISYYLLHKKVLRVGVDIGVTSAGA